MDPIFQVYVDRLRKGQTECLDGEAAPDFIEVNEQALRFEAAVRIQGQAYLAHEELVLDLSVQTSALMPCRICNQWVSVPIDIPKLYHVESIAKLKRGFVDLRPILREAILIEVPYVVECRQGNCPKREEIKSYLSDHDRGDEEGLTYQPFRDLDA